MGDNLTLSPAGSLEFAVDGKQAASTRLHVVNNGSSAVALKVKTTQPSWYYVRPNQTILPGGEGESVDIEVTLAENESKRALALAKAGNPMDLSRHRFMVMSCTLLDSEANEMERMNTEQKKQAFATLWDERGSKVERGAGPVKNTKLKVVHTFVNDEMPSQRGLDANGNVIDDTGDSLISSESVSSRVEEMRQRMSELSDAVQALSVPDTFDDCIELFKELRQKYEALEDYTMTQMGELDAVRVELDGLNQDLAKEGREAIAARGDKDKGKATAIAGGKKGVLARAVDVRLPLLLVGLGVIVAYLAGRMLPPMYLSSAVS